jgi:hypothetical protein
VLVWSTKLLRTVLPRAICFVKRSTDEKNDHGSGPFDIGLPLSLFLRHRPSSGLRLVRAQNTDAENLGRCFVAAGVSPANDRCGLDRSRTSFILVLARDRLVGPSPAGRRRYKGVDSFGGRVDHLFG